MTTPTAITILGLGPGRYDDLTLQAHALLEQAARDRQTVYFRTLIHPTVEPIRQAIPNLRIESFDTLYDESADWGSLYQQIAEKICSLAAQHPVIYAVPGHPLVGEASVLLVLEMARERGLTSPNDNSSTTTERNSVVRPQDRRILTPPPDRGRSPPAARGSVEPAYFRR